MPSRDSWATFPPEEPKLGVGPSWREICELLESPDYDRARLRRLVGASVDLETLVELWRRLRAAARGVLWDHEFSGAIGPGELIELIPHRARKHGLSLDPQWFAQLEDLWRAVRSGKKAPTFPKRAAWLNGIMTDHKITRYQIREAGGPDYKTIKRVRNGEHVREDSLVQLQNALGFILHVPPEKIVIPND